MSQKAAHIVSCHIDHIVQSQRHGTRLDESTAAWLRTADKAILKRLTRYKLVNSYSDPTLAEFAETFLAAKRLDRAWRTIHSLTVTTHWLTTYFGESRRVSQVSSADAKEFHAWMKEQTIKRTDPETGNDIESKRWNENTIGRLMGRAREFFNDAMERELIARNPFKLRSISVGVGAAKKDYIARETIRKVIEVCPDAEWRLLFAFSRFAGVRMPSEIRDLTWQDINWESNSIRIKSPKTAHQGKAERYFPILDEFRQELNEAYDAAPENAIFVFAALRKHTNLGTTARKYVRRAGFTPWDKFWNALRASCETDLMDRFGIRKACQWIGNTPNIALKNYSLTRREDFIEAGNQVSANAKKESDAKSDAAQANITSHGASRNAKSLGNTAISKAFDSRDRIRTTARNAGNSMVNSETGAESDAANLKSRLLAAWDSLDAQSRIDLVETAEFVAGIRRS